MNRALAPLLPFTLLGGCAHPSAVVSRNMPVGPDRTLVARTVASAAGQVKRCYRSPKLNSMARQIITVLHVTYTPDGFLANSPVVIGQEGITDSSRVYAGQMARAAIEAVEHCVPLRLPPDLYENGWNAFDLTFSPRGLA
jgi:hypothetical protein